MAKNESQTATGLGQKAVALIENPGPNNSAARIVRQRDIGELPNATILVTAKDAYEFANACMTSVEKKGWVIEGAGTYWCGKNVHDFRPTWGDAVFFTRHADAERVLHWILPEEYRRVCRAAEHIIIGNGP